MEENFDYDLEDISQKNEAVLESMIDGCSQLKELAHETSDVVLEEVRTILEEFQENGFGVFSVHGNDDLADPIEEDDFALKLLEAAIQRRKDEGVKINPTHTIVASGGHVLMIDIDDLSKCNIVRSVG